MDQIQSALQDVIKQLFDLEDFKVSVTLAPEDQSADYATNVAMQLTGALKSRGISELNGAPISPRVIGEMLWSELASRQDFPFSIELAGPGFLNFISQDEYWQHKLQDFAQNYDKIISQDEYSKKTVICEFSDPNPFKVLHVGHLYTSIVGNAISNLIEFSGGKVVRANFGGDVGLHVAKTLYAIMKDNKDTADIETIASCYVAGTRTYEEDDFARQEITRLNQLIYQIAESGQTASQEGQSQVHTQNQTKDLSQDQPQNQELSRLSELYWRGRETSYQYFENFYQQIGVKFDKYYPESTVAPRGLAEVKAHTPAVYEQSDGAIVYKGEKDGLHTRVFINKDGLPTYETKDVGLLFTKWDDYHFDQSIVITGNDIIEYMKVVLTSVSKYSPELVERTTHLTHGNVRLPGNEKMSSRKGNFVRAVDVLSAVQNKIGEDANSKIIADGAIKYAFLKYRIGGDLEFNIDESVSMTGNSGVYLQYSALRAKKILAESSSEGYHSRHGLDHQELYQPASKQGKDSHHRAVSSVWQMSQSEKDLARKLLAYPEILHTAVQDLAPHKVATFLYELAQEFSRFYEHNKVIGSEYETERLELVSLFFRTISHGLKLLGISIPEKM